MTVTRKDNGKWRARAECGYDSNGQRVQREKTFATKAEAVAWLRSQEIKRGNVTNMTLNEFWEQSYYPYIEQRTRPNTNARYRADYDRLIREPLGARRLDSLTGLTIQTLIDGLETYGSKRNAFTILRQMLRRARAWGLVQSVATDGVTLPKHRREAISVIPADKLGDYLEAVAEYAPEILPGVCVSMLGARRSEVCALEWEDISFGDVVSIHIHASRVSFAGQIVTSGTKTEHSERTLIAPEPLAAILKERRSSGLILPMNPDTYSKKWIQAIEKAGLPRVTLKNVRHSIGTALVDSGLPLKFVQDVLGHDLETTTSRFYVQQSDVSFTAAAGIVGFLLNVENPTENAHESPQDIKHSV